jgi:hypothetical protein
MLVLDKKAYYKTWTNYITGTIEGGLDQMLERDTSGADSSLD